MSSGASSRGTQVCGRGEPRCATLGGSSSGHRGLLQWARGSGPADLGERSSVLKWVLQWTLGGELPGSPGVRAGWFKVYRDYFLGFFGLMYCETYKILFRLYELRCVHIVEIFLGIYRKRFFDVLYIVRGVHYKKGGMGI